MASTTTTVTETFWSKWSSNSTLNFVTRKAQIAEPPKEERSIRDDEIPEGFFTEEEVSRHSNPRDCWIVINDKVYDVSKFAEKHPGGPIIFTQAGRNATDSFRLFHTARAWQQLQEFHIGDLYNPEPVSELLKDYRELRSLLLRSQMFKCSKAYYVYKAVTNFALLAASMAVISWSTTFWAVLLSSFLMGLFLQQCGWVAHDFAHNQVFEPRSSRGFLGGLFWGNVAQGFSLGWWKTKHNVHHAVTNECDEKYQPIDPDIDTLPLLAWSNEILATVDDRFTRSIISKQHLMFFPLLFLARLSWLYSSWAHVSCFDMPKSIRWAEKVTLLAHYAGTLAIPLSFLPVPRAICWVILAELFSGFFLSVVFVVSHNGMEMYNDPRDFVTAQLCSTRNIKNQFFYDWFSGGLNWQIEHHLFPTIPRHNLHKVEPYVKALCAKHGLMYEEISLVSAVARSVNRLRDVAAVARASLQTSSPPLVGTL
ncbi:hypothetical protein R1sor_005784 [Riccia sorocarpa]|uniref:Cytochrome b5 heme-binding domain-containing protein n=1 Tax=Riccia sorocarpa TaxID=122646 RepID=A0ABD3HKI6_9MARC